MNKFLLACLMLIGGDLSASTLTITNSTPPLQIPLEANSSVKVAVDGNVSARCVLDGNTCVGTGGPTQTLSVSLVASNFSSVPVNGLYPLNTSFVMTQTVSGTATVDLCVRELLSGTTTGWAGVVNPPVSPVTLVLNASNTTFSFRVKCYANNAAPAISNTVTLITRPTPPNGVDQCETPIAPPTGFTRQIPPTAFTDLRNFSQLPCFDFPQTGSPVCVLLVNRNKFVSIKFTAPTDLSLYNPGAQFIAWQSAQQGGQADESRTHASITQCMGDFRIPTSAVGPANDPTLAFGCRNIFFPNGTNNPPTIGLGISYNLTGVASGGRCGIIPGNTYYFNYILASPDGGGILPGEHNCLNPDQNTCGIQLRAQ